MPATITDPNLNGMQRIAQAIEAKPILELCFYPQGIFRRLHDELGTVETVITPEDLAKVLAQVQKPTTWNTGILSQAALMVGEQHGGRLVVEYRPPQMAGIWLEGSDEPVRIPLPGLVLMRFMQPSARPQYLMFAVKRRPTNAAKTKLYCCPLPNTYATGSICWGTVAAPTGDKLHETRLDADWEVLLGSKFGDHSVAKKSIAHMDDIRKTLLALEASKAAKYSLDDLVDAKMTLAETTSGMGDKRRAY